MKCLTTIAIPALLIALSACHSGTDPDTSGGTSQPVSSTETSRQAHFEYLSYQGQSQEQVSVGEDEYRNPILSGYYPDPSVTRVGDDYYLVTSTFTHFPGLPIFHSKDLVNWTQISNAIDRPDQFDFKGIAVSRGIFAPDISYHDGTYYLVSTCVDCGGNFVMTASDPAGPWSDPYWLGFEGIDPSIHWGDDKAYILNNGAPNEEPRYDGHRAIWIQEFDWQNKQMVGERTQLINGGVDISEEPVWIEGPHLFKRNGYYYITAAEGGTSVWHSQTIFRSDNPLGPFEPADHNPILTQRDLDPERENPIIAAGHAKFVQIPNGDWWATFLAIRPYGQDLYNTGRETFLLPVTWKNDWPYILPQGEPIPFTHEKPELPEQPAPDQPTSGDFAYKVDFTQQTLGPQWIGIRNPSDSFYEVANGTLSLSCNGGFGNLEVAPSFVGRRQQHHIANFETLLSFDPTKDGDRAGLAAVQNDESLIFFGIEQIDGESNVVAYKKDGAEVGQLVDSEPVASTDEVRLAMEMNGGRMTLRYRVGTQEKVLVKNLDATNLSTPKAGGFVGTVVGFYCDTGN